MARLLDRYQRLSDGKEFAIVAIGTFNLPDNEPSRKDEVTLEAEDGERVESRASVLRGHGRFERIDD